MKSEKTIAEYFDKFGDVPWEFCEGDESSFLNMLDNAIKSGAKIPDYFEENNLPRNALL